MAHQSGSGGYVEIGGVRLDVTGWQAEETADWADTTGAGSGGYRQSVLVRRRLAGTVSAAFDPGRGPKGAPQIAAGSTVTLALHTAAGERYNLTANVERLRWVTPADDRITFAFDFESNGSYSYGAL